MACRSMLVWLIRITSYNVCYTKLLRKAAAGLPHYDAATARQRKDGMYWRDPEERYNDGKPFKLVCRDHRGVIRNNFV